VFYDLSKVNIRNKFELPEPKRNSTKSTIEQFSSTSNFAKNPTFLLIYGDAYQGKSHTISRLARTRINHLHPTLYIDLRDEFSDV